MIKLIQVAVCKCIINWSKPEFSGRNENMRQQESWEVEDKRKPETERPPWLNTVFHILKNLNRSWIDRHFVFGL